MMLAVLFSLALAAVQAPVQTPVRDAAADIAAARQLYATAAYEEALDRLSRVSATDVMADQVDTYRALCLLALGRTRESEQILERVLTRNPRYTLDERDVSPRLVQLFRAVRSRLLPVAARNLYTNALASFDAKQFETARRQFRELIDLLDADPIPESGSSHLRVLADGFLRQADAALKAAPEPQRGSGDVTGYGLIYTKEDRDVVAPVEVSRPVPIMAVPRGEKPALYQGLIEIVINEVGRVEQVAIKVPINPEFDSELVASTGFWRFEPARKDGKPVKFRRAYEIIGHSR